MFGDQLPPNVRSRDDATLRMFEGEVSKLKRRLGSFYKLFPPVDGMGDQIFDLVTFIFSIRSSATKWSAKASAGKRFL